MTDHDRFAAYARQERPAREAPAALALVGVGTGLHRWAEAMSATGRRRLTAVAASRFRQWVDRTHEDRPTRGEIRAWGVLVLNERRELIVRAEKAERERNALQAQRDNALEEERTAREASTRYAEEADELRDALTAMPDPSAQVKVYEEMRTAYEAAEAERNRLARNYAHRGDALNDERAARIAAEAEVERLTTARADARPTAEDVASEVVRRLAADAATQASAWVDEDRSIVVTVERRFTIEEFRRADWGAGAK